MGMDASQMIAIRGNIRQQYLPFVLNPNTKLNANITDEHDITDGPQLFSFRNKNASEYKAGFGRLGICPSVMYSPEFGMFFNKDISNRLLYDRSTNGMITIDSYLNELPGMQIREFQVDAKLDQFINLFFELFRSAKGFFKEFKMSEAFDTSSDAGDRWRAMFGEVMNTAWNFVTAQEKYKSPPNFYTDKNGQSRWKGIGKAAGKAAGKVAAGAAAGGAFGAAVGAAAAVADMIDVDTYIMEFPYTLYYRLQSCTTLNVYELPFVAEQSWASDGHGGWAGKQMAVKDLAGGDRGGGAGSMLGKVVELLSPVGDLIDRARINYMPRWDPTGSGTMESLTVTFDLFNDTADAAMQNFIFVNTIIPNNLWMQYGMLRHSPCLYDIKVDGFKRMFLCSGDFEVKSQGLQRTPTYGWLKKLCDDHANGKGGKVAGSWPADELLERLAVENLVRIPDVYTVKMTFKSLIPANFNNFLYSYNSNKSIETEYINKDAHHPSVIGEVLKSVASDLGDEIKNVIDAGNKEIKAAREKEKAENENGGAK